MPPGIAVGVNSQLVLLVDLRPDAERQAVERALVTRQLLVSRREHAAKIAAGKARGHILSANSGKNVGGPPNLSRAHAQTTCCR